MEVEKIILKKSERKFINKIRFDLYDGERYVGWGGIRLKTTKAGDVVYRIKEEERRKGYGTKLLELLLMEAGKMGKEKVVVVARESNIGSRKIIEKNGGKQNGERILKGEEKKIIYEIKVPEIFE